MHVLPSLPLAIMSWYLSFSLSPDLVMAVFETKQTGMRMASPASNQFLPSDVDGDTSVGKIELQLSSGPSNGDGKESLKFTDFEDVEKTMNSEIGKMKVGLKNIKTRNTYLTNRTHASFHNHHENWINVYGRPIQRGGQRQYPPWRYKFLNSNVKFGDRNRESQDVSERVRFTVLGVPNVLFKRHSNLNVPNSIQDKNYTKMTGLEANSRFNKRIKRQIVGGRSSNGNETTSTILESCKGKCGKEYYLPCSCSKRCVVYKNCCEGFTEDCPNTASDGKKEYADFLEAQIVCTDSNFLVITSCRKDSLPLNGSFSELSEPTTLKEFINVKGPVFDLFTRLVFLDQSIFQCNKYPESEGAICGSLQLNIDDAAYAGRITDERVSFQELSGDLMSGKIAYVFIPDLKSYPEVNDCFYSAQRICTVGFLDMSVYEDYKDKCEKLTSYVSCSDVIYANSYCMKCSNLFKDIAQCYALTESGNARSGGANALSLLVSFDNNDDNVVLTAGGKLASKHQWDQISCNISSKEPCAHMSCPNKNQVKKNGMCTQKAYTVIDMFAHYQLDRSVVNSLQDLVVCSLKQTEGSTNVINIAEPTQVYDVLKHKFHIHAGFTFNTPFQLHFGEEKEHLQSEDILHMTALYNDIVRIYIWYADLVTNGKVLASGPMYGCFCAGFDFCTTTCSNWHTYEVRNNSSTDLLEEYNGKCASALSSDMLNGDDNTRPWKGVIIFVINLIFSLTL